MASDYLQKTEAIFPEEPPVGSVVLGKSGIAWQSYSRGDENVFWSPTRGTDRFYHEHGQKWGYLIIEEAPLKLLWKGDTSNG